MGDTKQKPLPPSSSLSLSASSPDIGGSTIPLRRTQPPPRFASASAAASTASTVSAHLTAAAAQVPSVRASATATAAGRQQKQPQQAFWGNLKIEIDPPYEGKPPEWHTEQSDSTSIPAHLSSSSSPSETDLSHLGSSGEAFHTPKPEPAIAKHITMCLACALIIIGGGQIALQIVLLVQLHYTSSWWGGAFSVLSGLLGLAKWECTRMTHRSFAAMGILLNAIAAVLETRASSLFRADPELFCGPPGQGTGGAANSSLQTWCGLKEDRLDVWTCACIIPGRDPGSTEACVSFRGLERGGEGGGGGGGGEEDCYASAEGIRRLMNVSAALCWTMAVICLLACLARVGFTCYTRKGSWFRDGWVSARGGRRKKGKFGAPTIVVFDREPMGGSGGGGGRGEASRGEGGIAPSSSRSLVDVGGMEEFQLQLRHLEHQQQQQQQQQEERLGGRKGKKTTKKAVASTCPYYLRDQPVPLAGARDGGDGGEDVEMR